MQDTNEYVGSRVEQSNREAEALANREYKHGWVTDIESETFPPGLNEDVIRAISAKKDEPEWLLDFRLKAYAHWQTLEEPRWPNVDYDEIDYQAISYYSAPKKKAVLGSLDEADPELIRTQSAPRRAFQGWRYLNPEDAPADLSGGRTVQDDVPPELQAALADLGVL